MILYIVRHGDPDYSTDSLTPRGVLQAEAVAKRLKDSGITQIYSSPMGRALQTAEPACKLLGLPCNVEDWAHEIGQELKTTYPDGESRSVVTLQNTHYLQNGIQNLPYDRALEAPPLTLSQMGKAVKYIEENGKNFLERLGYREENGVYRILQPSEERVALFCHGAFTMTWLSVLLHIPLHILLSSFTITHTGVTILRFANTPDGFTAPRMHCWSDMSHLYKYDDVDMLFNGRIPM